MTRDYASSQQEVANELGVNRHTVKDWLQRGAPGRTEDGYDVEAIRNWKDLNVRDAGDEIDFDDEETVDGNEYKRRFAAAKLLKIESEAKKTQAEANIKKFEEKQTTEDVVHRHTVELFLNLFFGETRRVFTRIPQEMKGGYPDDLQQTISDDLEARIGIALRAVSGYCRRVADIRDE